MARSAELLFLRSAGVRHLVTLSSECPPHPAVTDYLRHTVLHVEEFEAPTLQQIDQFVNICKEAAREDQAVAVHCRMGRGRTGVMVACYLVAFADLTPQEAISRTRQMRPYSVETYQQERSVGEYYDLFCKRRT
ncbi:dual specificity protein phosphatase 23-like [Pollicipes pollicipes]|uniref:dual specificity protein phosphatase 23-like n=1 Tax=Pollicipes pollicipes TaxID=41117 RepID=UPI0018853FA6|nr:dual specificity protein phosphatase 23-like [Pollicipes pollicipes]